MLFPRDPMVAIEPSIHSCARSLISLKHDGNVIDQEQVSCGIDLESGEFNGLSRKMLSNQKNVTGRVKFFNKLWKHSWSRRKEKEEFLLSWEGSTRPRLQCSARGSFSFCCGVWMILPPYFFFLRKLSELLPIQIFFRAFYKFRVPITSGFFFWFDVILLYIYVVFLWILLQTKWWRQNVNKSKDPKNTHSRVRSKEVSMRKNKHPKNISECANDL